MGARSIRVEYLVSQGATGKIGGLQHSPGASECAELNLDSSVK